ncbi:DUF4062 domain-containing protein [Brevundimonas sp. FT23042]|uniref:DUF4062 domain-containing protein n=1 Tax=Brevundimonas sp. FT23042 TaxID=3393749 RepID=UPI003B58A1FA
MAKIPQKPPTIMISSTVYGIEELLDRMYAVLTAFGYDVWCSHMGTLPTISTLTAFENCIKAVEDCDLFLGLITPLYGSGIPAGQVSITHQELETAIRLRKPRWLLAHDHVVFARTLLRQLGHDTKEKRAALINDDAVLKAFKRSRVIDDLRVIDMYEAAIRNDLDLADREGNWVQKYAADEDALRYATAQFYRFQEVEAYLSEQLSNPAAVMRHVEGDRARQLPQGGSQ